MNKTLADLRKEIDTVDDELVNLLAKRFAVVREIGKLKKLQQIQPLDERRWKDVLQKITEKAKNRDIPQDLVKKIYDEIHKTALSLEKDHE